MRGLGVHRDRLVEPAGRGAHGLALGAHAGLDELLRRTDRGRAPRSTATATLHSRAAELDSPAPTGTSLVMSMSMPWSHLERDAAPRRRTAPSCRRPRGASSAVPSHDRGPLVTATTSSSRRRDPCRGALGQRDRQAATAVVVDVLADQVHPARARCRSPDRSRRRGPVDSSPVRFLSDTPATV